MHIKIAELNPLHVYLLIDYILILFLLDIHL